MHPDTITRTWIEDRLDMIYPAHTAATVRWLVKLRDSFDGDLDAMLIVAVVAIGVRGENWKGALLETSNELMTVESTNTLSIAQATGIPRESARRKLNTLQGKGWLTRDDSGNWILTEKIATDLQEATSATVDYIRAVSRLVLQAKDV